MRHLDQLSSFLQRTFLLAVIGMATVSVSTPTQARSLKDVLASGGVRTRGS